MAIETMTLSGLQSWARAQAAGYSDFTVPMKLSSESIKSETKRNFDQGRSPSGQKWASLTEMSILGRRESHSQLPLRDTGLLMQSVIAQGEGHIEEMTKTSLTVGTNLRYAHTHQEGATIRPVRAKALAIPVHPEARYYNPRTPGDGRGVYPGKLFPVFSVSSGAMWLVDAAAMKAGGDISQAVRYRIKRQVTVPARPFLGFNDRIVQKLDRIMDDWLTKQLRGGG